MSKELSPLVIYQIFKGKYLAKYEFSTTETIKYDAKCLSEYSLLGYILFYCYYTAVACKNYGVSMAYKFSMAYFSRTDLIKSVKDYIQIKIYHKRGGIVELELNRTSYFDLVCNNHGVFLFIFGLFVICIFVCSSAEKVKSRSQ